MAQKVEVIPQVGVILEGKTICLGSTRADVEQTLGSGEAIRWNSLYTHWATIGVGVENYYE